MWATMRGVTLWGGAIGTSLLLAVAEASCSANVSPGHENRTAVVLRMHGRLKLDVAALYLDSLDPERYDFYVLYDDTDVGRLDPRVCEAFASFAKQRSRVRAKLVSFGEDHLRGTYPGVDFEMTRGFRNTPLGPRRMNIAWGAYHVMLTAWRRQVAGGAPTGFYPYVWAVEDDVRLSGDDYSAFFDSLAATDTSSFLFTDKADNTTAWSRYWTWPVADSEKHKVFTQITRYSADLLDHLDGMLTLGLNGWDEFFTATVCGADRRCTMRGLGDHLATPVRKFFKWDGEVTRADWESRRRAQPGKWFHPLKWLGDCRSMQALFAGVGPLKVKFPRGTTPRDCEWPPGALDDGASRAPVRKEL